MMNAFDGPFVFCGWMLYTCGIHISCC